MTFLAQFALPLLGLLFCAGDVGALAVLLTCQERAPTPRLRRQRLLPGVLPGTVLLLGLLLLALVQLLLLWWPAQAAGPVAEVLF